MAVICDFLYPLGYRVEGDGVAIEIAQHRPARPLEGYVAAYTFAVQVPGSNRWAHAGRIALRLGDDAWLCTYAGQIGYGIELPYRGHGYAARACRLVEDIALRQGFTELWITCNPENTASRKTAKRIGATLFEIVAVPPGNAIFDRGERRKCRYRWALGRGS